MILLFRVYPLASPAPRPPCTPILVYPSPLPPFTPILFYSLSSPSMHSHSFLPPLLSLHALPFLFTPSPLPPSTPILVYPLSSPSIHSHSCLPLHLQRKYFFHVSTAAEKIQSCEDGLYSGKKKGSASERSV